MRYLTKGLKLPAAHLDQVEHLRGRCGLLAKAAKEAFGAFMEKRKPDFSSL